MTDVPAKCHYANSVNVLTMAENNNVESGSMPAEKAILKYLN